jgi:rhomboid protease GluP
MFLHYGTGHIFGNMMVLLFVGDNLERVIGKFRYLIFYILSGIIAGCVSVAYQYYLGNFYVGLGASGAIFGIVGGVTFLAIKNKGRLEDLKGTNLLLFVGLTIFEGLATQEVDNAAHIGGLVAGVVLASILYNSYKKAIAKKYGA